MRSPSKVLTSKEWLSVAFVRLVRTLYQSSSAFDVRCSELSSALIGDVCRPAMFSAGEVLSVWVCVKSTDDSCSLDCGIDVDDAVAVNTLSMSVRTSESEVCVGVTFMLFDETAGLLPDVGADDSDIASASRSLFKISR